MCTTVANNDGQIVVWLVHVTSAASGDYCLVLCSLTSLYKLCQGMVIVIIETINLILHKSYFSKSFKP